MISENEQAFSFFPFLIVLPLSPPCHYLFCSTAIVIVLVSYCDYRPQLLFPGAVFDVTAERGGRGAELSHDSRILLLTLAGRCLGVLLALALERVDGGSLLGWCRFVGTGK